MCTCQIAQYKTVLPHEKCIANLEDSSNIIILSGLYSKYENYGAVYELRAYTNKPNEYLKIQSEVRKKIYDLFRRHRLDFTVPQAQINMDNETSRELTQRAI
jgi:esterase/lipase superfamily enzyme